MSHPPLPRDPRYTATLEALRRLAARSGADSEIAADRARLEEAWADWCERTAVRFGRCPTCSRFNLSSLWGVEHVVGCLEHPAIRAERRAEAEWHVASAVARALGHEVPLASVPAPIEWPAPTRHGWREPEGSTRPFLPFVGDEEARRAIAVISDGRSDGEKVTAHVRTLEVMLVEWGHYLERSRMCCPCCGDPHDLRELSAHVAGCRSHPSWRRAEALRAAVASLTNGAETRIDSLMGEMERTRAGCTALEEACWRLLGAFGYHEPGRSWIRDSDVDAFQRAVSDAHERMESLAPARVQP